MKRKIFLFILVPFFLNEFFCDLSGQELSEELQHIASSLDNDSGLNQGYSLYRQGKFNQAEQIFLKILEKDPDNYDARVNLGAVYFNKDLIDQAVNEYETSIRLNPEKPQAFFNLGLLYNSLKDYDKALRFFKKADEVDPSNRTTLFFIGETYFNLKDYDNALESFLSVWHFAPESERNLYRIADIYQIKRNYELEAAVYKQILRRRKTSYGYFRLAVALNKLNDRKGEIDAYKNALAINPDNPDIIYNLALAYRDENRLDESLEQFEKLIKNKTEPDEDALYYASIICADTNKVFKAWEYYEILSGMNPEKAEEIYVILQDKR